MRYRIVSLVALVILMTTAVAAGLAQTERKSERPAVASAYRTLTGRVTDLQAREQTVTLAVPAEAAKTKKARTDSWLLSVGRQTLLLRAGRNNQFAAATFDELKKGDQVQAVASLQADPDDRSHTAWWIVVYPSGTTPAPR